MKLVLSLFLSLVSFALLRQTQAVKWSECSSGDDEETITVTDVIFIPDSPHAGDLLNISVRGDTAEGTDIPGGSVDIHVKYRGVLIYMESEDLCKRTTCPVEGGPLVLETSQALPVVAPPGPYTVQVSVKDPDGVENMCVEVDFTMLPPGKGPSTSPVSLDQLRQAFAAARQRDSVGNANLVRVKLGTEAQPAEGKRGKGLVGGLRTKLRGFFYREEE